MPQRHELPREVAMAGDQVLGGSLWTGQEQCISVESHVEQILLETALRALPSSFEDLAISNPPIVVDLTDAVVDLTGDP